MSDEPSDPQTDQQSAYAMAFGLGAELLGALAVCGVPGYLLDKKLGTEPWLTLVGVLMGIALGLFQLVRATSKRQNGGKKRG